MGKNATPSAAGWHALTKYGHGEERGETYPIYVDAEGRCWTWDPDETHSLCPCAPWNVEDGL